MPVVAAAVGMMARLLQDVLKVALVEVVAVALAAILVHIQAQLLREAQMVQQTVVAAVAEVLVMAQVAVTSFIRAALAALV
jgi:hypothetical protein